MNPTPSAPASRPHAGRVAWITGSTSGIGLAVARHLASEGAAIALHGQAAASAETDALVREIAQTHGVPVRHYGWTCATAAPTPRWRSALRPRWAPSTSWSTTQACSM